MKLKEKLYNIYSKISEYLFKLKVKITGMELNPKGECVYNYCKKIVNGEWTDKDYIQEYENYITNAIEKCAEEGYNYTREEVAAQLCEVIGIIKES